jgi:hypothetical protein
MHAICVNVCVLCNTLFRIPKDSCYINSLLQAEGVYNTINNSRVGFPEFVITDRNILRSVLFLVCQKVSLNFAYCWKLFNVTQRMESIPNGDSASRPVLQFVSVNEMLKALSVLM